MQANSQNNSRNYGIDALKLVSMFMVLILHTVQGADLLDKGVPPPVQFVAQWLQAGSFAAVNIFALTTGYLMVNRKIKIKRILDLWLQVVVYSVTSFAVLCCIGLTPFSLKGLAKLFFPIIFNRLWYFTDYFALFLLMPFLNKMLHALNQRQTWTLAGVCLALFSVIATLSNTDPFNMDYGYSLIWLVVLYILGGAIQRFEPFTNVKKRWWLGLYLLSWAALFGSKPLLLWLTKRLLGVEAYGDLMYTYCSPVVLVMALAVFFLFRNMTFPKPLQTVWGFAAPFSFAIYAIHCNFQFVLNDTMAVCLNTLPTHPLVVGGLVLVLALVAMAVCIAVEFLRMQVFRLLGISKPVAKIGDFCDRKLGLYNE